MRRFYDLLFAWGAIVYGAGFFACFFGSWYWAGHFEIAHLGIAIGWPLLLNLFVLGFLLTRFYW